jgi:hypothetical protein
MCHAAKCAITESQSMDVALVSVLLLISHWTGSKRLETTQTRNSVDNETRHLIREQTIAVDKSLQHAAR